MWATMVRATAAAAAGDFAQAIGLQKQALEKAPSSERAVYEERLTLFQERQPYIRKPAWWRGGLWGGFLAVRRRPCAGRSRTTPAIRSAPVSEKRGETNRPGRGG
jgi:hypothetical protein